MNIIELYENLKGSYKSYLESFVTIKDERIKEKVSDSIKHEELWPKALIQFNPNFEKGIGVKELIAKGFPIHPDLEYFFDKPFYKHQQDAIELGCQDKEFIVTSGTGSGKSRTYGNHFQLCSTKRRSMQGQNDCHYRLSDECSHQLTSRRA